eukprot:CCRYP_020125-RA/>CCRYP_020125-RA protein AED:0.20 eAED:0.20 QI:173/1/1/1/1/1/2/1122/161
MSQQPETPKTPHAEPKLCKMGCGFFGSNATGDCCSKCWAQVRPKTEATKKSNEERSPASNEHSEKVDSLQVKAGMPPAVETAAEQLVTEPAPTVNVEPVSSDKPVLDETSPAKKKKKKKASYKSMMAGMLEGNSATRDLEKEKEKLRDGMGGGHFKKIDQI